MSPPPCLRIEQRDEVCVVHLEGQGSGALALRDELVELLTTVQPRKVLLDLHGILSFGDCHLFSAMFKGEMVRLRRKMDSLGGELRICGMCDMVRDAFRLSNLDGTALAIYDSVEEALAEF